MCWLGFLYGLLVMGVILAMGWFFEWLEQQRWKGTAISDEGPLLSELDLLRIAREYEGHKEIDLMIREIRRCWR
ncbi:MAG TPA: hypothetical protein VLK82_18800 [Candidatus Tectomicrobia bacterium]|nr:hypothetical protein [Candidatus Tectomicrobia bacterium]